MTILDKIAAHKLVEIKRNLKTTPVSSLEKSPLFNRDTYSLKKSLTAHNSTGIIAEYKRKSPSKGIINNTAEVKATTSGYAQGGAAGLSVLTDTDYFGGKNEDLEQARSVNTIPMLRKDFIVDEYQIIEAKSIGADVILLIAGILEPEKINRLAQFAHSLQMEVLLEVHDKEELLRSLTPHADIIGVNNRNLKDFTVSVETSFELAELIPQEFIKISESAISSAKTIYDLKKAGFKGFLIGETFMKTSNPALAFSEFVQEIKNYSAV